jgi:hypothetical protein
MSTTNDVLTGAESPDRVFYATGVLLDANDFTAEQSYHRGRLARALAFLHGSGTVAGLKVEHELATAPTTEFPQGTEEHLEVNPGLAIDRLGRLIEVPRAACMRLGRWYDEIAARRTAEASGPRKDTVDDLIQAHHGPPFNGVVADVFLRFAACERGKTPAFATGPFDALDAVQPSRLRDAYELKLVLRKEANPPLPESHWPDLGSIADPAARRTAVQEAIFNAWPRDETLDPDDPEPTLEYPPDFDRAAVFLARITIPAAPSAAPQTAPARSADPVRVDNSGRLFVYRARALARAHAL